MGGTRRDPGIGHLLKLARCRRALCPRAFTPALGRDPPLRVPKKGAVARENLGHVLRSELRARHVSPL